MREMDALADETYDFTIVAFNGLDYISHPDRLKALREIHRVLKDNAIFVFSSHNKNFIKERKFLFPRPPLTLNICRLVVDFFPRIKMMWNYLMRRKLHLNEETYSIVNDGTQEYTLLTYYIDKKSQLEQLKKIGFELIEIYDMFGKPIELDDEDRRSIWNYYVVRKKS